MQITKDIHKISGEGNVYLLLKPEPTLIDTGSLLESEKIINQIKKIIDPDKIKNVLLTHLHYDHAGNTKYFKNAKIYASKDEIADFKSHSEYFFFEYPAPKDLSRVKPLPKEEILDLKIISCPGHTRGGVSFLDEKNKLLFSGDTLFQNGIGRTDLPNSLPGKMNESVEKLAKLVSDEGYNLMPGHDY